MKTKMANHLIIIGILLMGAVASAPAGTITVTTTPAFLTASGEQYVLINKDDAASTGVAFSATETHTNGTVSAWQWYFHNGTPSSSTAGGSGSSNPGTVTFSNADGQNNACTAGVTHTGSNGESCASSASVVSTVDVVIPKITGVGDNGSGSVQDIWFFQDGTGVVQTPYYYPITLTVTLTGITASEAGTISWSIQGQSDTVNFDNNQETKSDTSLSETIHTVGYSSSENNMYIQAVIHGVTIKSPHFTARCPVQITPSASTSWLGSTWQTVFTYSLSDKFGDVLIPGLSFCEVFSSPSSWPNDYSGGNNWPTPNYGNGYVFSDSTIADTYSPGYFTGMSPTPVSGGTTLVRHNGQTYKVGGSGTAGYSATGFVIDSFTLQFRLGSANHQ